MQIDFHYYATYCAAFIAGYSSEESLEIGYADEFTDHCTVTLLKKIGARKEAATSQIQLELANMPTDILGIQEITRIWSSFHFLPYDLQAEKKGCSRRYLNKYRLICKPNGELLKDTVEIAKNGSLQAVGIAMHILADTWSHSYFAGTPSLVINNTNFHFYELVNEGGTELRKKIKFSHNPAVSDDVISGHYTASVYQGNEKSIMNLGHGRAGHFPDYSFARYAYLPAWGEYEEIIKDNPTDYYKAFCQMVYAMKYLRGEIATFEKDTYAYDIVEPYREEIMSILTKRRRNATEGWKEFGEKLTGVSICDFDEKAYFQEYMSTPKQDRDKTVLGRFIFSALEQKSMVTNRIFSSGSLLAGVSVNYEDMNLKDKEKFKRFFESVSRRKGT